MHEHILSSDSQHFVPIIFICCWEETEAQRKRCNLFMESQQGGVQAKLRHRELQFSVWGHVLWNGRDGLMLIASWELPRADRSSCREAWQLRHLKKQRAEHQDSPWLACFPRYSPPFSGSVSSSSKWAEEEAWGQDACHVDQAFVEEAPDTTLLCP